MAAVSRRGREKAGGQEAIVTSRCCRPRGAGGLGRSVGMGQQGAGVIPRHMAASPRGGTEAQEGWAARGAQSIRQLHQGQLVVVERGLKLGGRQGGPARAVGAEETARRPAAPQQGQRGFGTAVQPRKLGTRRAVGKTKQSESSSKCPDVSKGPPTHGQSAAPFSPPSSLPPAMLRPPAMLTPSLPPPSAKALLPKTMARSLL